MEIYNPTVELIAITPDAEKLIEEAGRTCYLSVDNTGKNENFIQNAIKNGHHSIIEHASASFRVKGASRAFTHQVVRHRVASFSQQSQRYVNEDNYNYIVPPSIKNNPDALKIYQEFMENTRSVYKSLREMNVLKEDARFILPNAIESEIVISANFREFRHIFDLRLDKHAQWEIRKVAFAMLELLIIKAPKVFGDYILNNDDYTAHSKNNI